MCMSRKINHLIEFLNKNYKVGKNDDCTNTSMSNGKWNIPQEDYPVFLSEYCKYIKTQTSHDDIHLIERHNEYSPIIIDLDFRFGKDEIKRKYEKSQITSLINIYQQQIVKDLDIEPVAFVFEREEPYISRGIVKDGVHIMFPFVITKPEYQHYLRDKVLEKCDEVIEEINCTNDKKDIIDKSVIYSNGWFMYGSCKPGQKPYKLTSIYGNNVVEINKEEFSGFDETKLPSILSIRNKLEPTQFKREVNLENYDKSRGYIKRKHINKNITKVNLEDLHTVEKLINILDVKRADNYDYWIKLGMCLHNIDSKLLYNWIEFSKKSSKFDSEGSCEMKWNSFDNSTSSKKIQIGSLHHWAKEDNQIEYEKIISEDIQQFIVNNIKGQGNHSDIASVVYKMFGDKFVCSNIKHKAWWEFKYHRWHQIDQGITLRKKISKDLVDEFFKLQKRYAEQILSTEDEEIRNNIQSKCECIFKIVDKLKNATFKDSVMKECMEVFYICKFEEKLDSKDELICFNNGIYDLKEGVFRDGNPEDFISLCTYVDYIPYNCLDNNTRNVESFMKKIFPDKEVREYVYKYLSCCLEGGNNIEKFHILYGVGCHKYNTPILMYNGKIKMVQDVQIGDKLMGDDSTERNVIDLKRGKSDMYNIIPKRTYESFIVNGEHILCLKSTTKKRIYYRKERNGWYVNDIIIKNGLPCHTSTSFKKDKQKAIEYYNKLKENIIIEISVKKYIENIKKFGRNWSLYIEPINFNEKEVEFDPYMLGYWLGDGNSDSSIITTMDEPVIKYFEEKTKEMGLKNKIYGKKGEAVTIGYSSNKNTKCNKFLKFLQKNNLIKNKHIPEQYKCNSKNVRLNILAGLIDSDGYYQESAKQYEITQKNKSLADDIVYLVRSLGIGCSIKEVEKSCIYKNEKRTGIYYRIIFSGQGLDKIPVKLERKKFTTRNKKKDTTKVGFTIEKVNNDNFYGFELDGNHRYIMGNFIVSHNSNGKSKLIELLEGCFGEYSCKIPISVITQKRIGAGQADPFLARTKGKRFVSFDEPNKEDKINPGLMKNLTGGDKIATRGLFRDPIEFKPAFKPLLVCNHLPNVPSEDQGTWRRIVGIELKSRFTENPNPNNKNEFKVDRRLASKIEKWHSAFMSILIEKYKNYIKNGLEPPIEIINFTSKYRQDVDFFFEFLNDNTEKDNMSSINMRLLYGRFKDWFKNNDMDGKCPKKKELDQYIEERYEVSNGNLLKYKLLNHLNTLTTEQVESLYGGSSTGGSSKGTIHSESDGASVVSSSNVSTCSSVSLLDFNNNKIRLSNYDMCKTYIKLTGKEMKKKSGLTAERLDLYKKYMNLTVKEMREKIIPNWPKRQNCLAHSDHLRNDIKLGYIVLIPNNIIEL